MSLILTGFKKKTCKSTLFSHGNIKKLHYTVLLACEQALQGTLVAGWEKEGELATMSLEFEFCLQFPCGSLSTKLLDFWQSAQSRNEGEWKQTLKKTCKHAPRVMTSLLMSSPPISISHWLFWSRFSNSRDIVASSPPSSCPEASLGKPKSSRLLLSNICKSQGLNFCTKTIICYQFADAFIIGFFNEQLFS